MLKKLLAVLAFTVLIPCSVLADPPARLSQGTTGLLGGPFPADLGLYFCAMTATPGTAYTLTGATQNAFAATTAIATIVNTADVASGIRIYPDVVRITFATAGTGGTRFEAALALDSTNRYSSGGTVLPVASANMDMLTVASRGSVHGGDITASAASGAVRYVGRTTVSTAIPVAGETYLIPFGVITQNTATQKVGTLPAVAIGPGQSAVVHAWLPGQSAAPTGEVQLCYWEK